METIFDIFEKETNIPADLFENISEYGDFNTDLSLYYYFNEYDELKKKGPKNINLFDYLDTLSFKKMKLDLKIIGDGFISVYDHNNYTRLEHKIYNYCHNFNIHVMNYFENGKNPENLLYIFDNYILPRKIANNDNNPLGELILDTDYFGDGIFHLLTTELPQPFDLIEQIIKDNHKYHLICKKLKKYFKKMYKNKII